MNIQIKSILVKCLKSLLLIVLITACFSCGSGGVSGSNSEQPNPPAPPASKILNIGNIVTIPVNPNVSTNTTTLPVMNNGTRPLTYISYSLVNQKANIKVNNKKHSVRGSEISFDVSKCTTIEPGSSCNITINVPTVSGSEVLKVVFKDDLGNLYTASQVISHSSLINPIGGFALSNTNLTVSKGKEDISVTSIPFLLDQTYDSLPQVANSVNAFKSDVSCSGNQYTKGTLCTALFEVTNLGTSSLVQNKITISGSSNTRANYQTTLVMTVTSNNVANLITSATNVIINPADGQSVNAELVYLSNSGLAAATNLQLSAQAVSPGVVITAGNVGDSCTNLTSLAVGATCSFFVNVNSGVTNASGQTFTTVNYFDGISSQVINFNVIYVAPNADVAMTMTTLTGSLQNVVKNSTASILINVSNTSVTNTTLNNISFRNLTESGMSYASSSTCATNGTQTLTQGQSCILVINYTPTTSTDIGTLAITQRASYTTSAGLPSTYTGASISIPYSSILSNAFLWVNPSAVTMSIRADGTTVTQTFVVTNSGGVSTTPSAVAFATAITGLSITNDACTGVLLNVGDTCVIEAQYGPKNVDVPNTVSNLNITYPTFNNPSSIAFSKVTVNASVAALIKITGLTISGTTLGGDGTVASPYTFTNAPGNQLTFVTTYKNTGSSSALDFNVRTNNLPYGYVVNSASTCPYNTSSPKTTLAVNESCAISVSAIDPLGYVNPYNIASGTAVNYTLLGYSYRDTNTGVNTNNSPSCFSGCTAGSTSGVVYVNAQAFASITSNTPTNSASAPNVTMTFTSATPAGSFPSGGVDIIVNIPTSGGGFIATNPKCTIATATGTCNVVLSSMTSMPVGVYNYSYIVAPHLGTSGINKSFSFTLN